MTDAGDDAPDSALAVLTASECYRLLGTHEVEVRLHRDVFAKLRVEVVPE